MGVFLYLFSGKVDHCRISQTRVVDCVLKWGEAMVGSTCVERNWDGCHRVPWYVCHLLTIAPSDVDSDEGSAIVWVILCYPIQSILSSCSWRQSSPHTLHCLVPGHVMSHDVMWAIPTYTGNWRVFCSLRWKKPHHYITISCSSCPAHLLINIATRPSDGRITNSPAPKEKLVCVWTDGHMYAWKSMTVCGGRDIPCYLVTGSIGRCSTSNPPSRINDNHP